MSEGLINWHENKGSPFKVPEVSYEFRQPTWRIITEEETDKISNIHKQEDFNFFKIFFPLSYYLWIICKLEEVETTRLLTGITYGNDYNDITQIVELELPDEIRFDVDKPVLVYTSYPFQSMVEIKIFPFKKMMKRFDGKEVAYTSTDLGYIIWCISKVYEKIYKGHWEEVEIWGHQFSDLAFGRVDFLNDNIVLLNLDS